MSDILDLLSDNSSNPKPTGAKKGFLNVLKKTSMTENNDNSKYKYGFEQSDDKYTKKELDNENFQDNNYGGFSKNEEDGIFSNTGNQFYKNKNSIDNKSKTTTGFFPDNKSPEPASSETFGFNRRRTTTNFASTNIIENNKNSPDYSDSLTKSPETSGKFNRRISSVIGPIKEMDREEDNDNAYIPSRARGITSILNNRDSKENSPSGGFDVNSGGKNIKTEDISNISFKKDRENSAKNENIDDAPKTLLKSYKNSPTNQDKRENNIRITEKDLSNNISEINIKNAKDINKMNEEKSIKNFNKQETSMTFGGSINNESDSLRINETENSDYYKIKLEKDYLDSQISFLKQKNNDDKNRFEELLNDEKEKLKKKEQENYKYIEELRQKFKEETLSLEEKHKITTQTLYEENKKIRAEIDREIQAERDRMNFIHKSDLENQENVFNKNFEKEKKFFEDKNETLKKQLQQQIEFNKLATKVESSSKQIDDIINKFYIEKEKGVDNDKLSLETKEKYLIELEEKLRESEKSLSAEKESISKMRKDFELRELEKKKELQEEKIRIEKEILRLQELQNSLKLMEYNSKEKYERERLELNQKQSEMKIEVDSIKNEYSQRLNELEYQQKIFNEEKKFFEKSKEETSKNIDLKKSELENRKKLLVEEEKDRKERIRILEEKEFFLREKFEEFDKHRINIEESKRKNEKDKQDCLIVFSRIKDNIKALDEKERRIEKEKEEIMKRFSDFENEKAYVNSEKIKIEQAKSELRLRMQSIEALRMKYVTSSISQGNTLGGNIPQFTTNNFEIKNFSNNLMPNTSSNNFYNTNKTNNFNQNIMDKNTEELRVSKSISRKSFNADEYMYNMKLKLGNGDYNSKNFEYENNSNFNQFLQKEKEYLKSLNNKPNNFSSTNNNEFISKNHMKTISNPNASLNIYETMPITNFGKENLSQNNYFQNSQQNFNLSNQNNFNTNKNLENNLNNVLSENKIEFKSFSKDPMDFNENNQNEINKLIKENEIKKNNENFNSINSNNSISKENKNFPKNNLFTSSQLLSNNFNNKITNLNSPKIGVQSPTDNSKKNIYSDNKKEIKKNIFDDIDEIEDISDLLPSNKNDKNKNEDDFDV